MKWGTLSDHKEKIDYKGDTAKPKPFIKGILETINQSYFYIGSLIVKNFSRSRQRAQSPAQEGGGTLGISGWECAAGTLESLTYTRASSAEFCYPILE